MEKEPAEDVHRIEITGSLDRHAVEALQLELRRLAKRTGVDIQVLRIERVEAESSA